MRIFEGQSISKPYLDMVTALLQEQNKVGETYEINNCCFIIHNPSTKNMLFPYRKKISEKYADAELRWYWSGDNSCHTIGKYAKLWLKLTDDGETNNSAYGYILFKKYGYNQLEQIIELLKKDKNTRRAVLNISDPTIDRINTKDMQCTIALQFLIRHNKLEETVYMRSSDLVFGIPYDYIFFVSIGQYIASRLNLEFSLYTHHSTSLHLYLKDLDLVKSDNLDYVSIDTEQIIKECYKNEN